MIGSELTLQLVALRLLAGVVMFTAQGATIAAIAGLLGDKGPRYDGRLTLMPLRQIDLLGLASTMLTGFGWGQPVQVDPGQLRFGRWGLVIVALAGSAVLLLIGYLILFLTIPLLTMLPYSAGVTAAAFVRVTARLCVWMSLFTLLPIPPLAGAHLLAAVGIKLPRSVGVWIGVVLLVASFFGITRMVLTPAYNIIAPLVIGTELAG
ncbi:site-2 protease family protein [Devosia sp. 2618]|uniref:site-2 protease family protein n=1 Tax=Devosia sp. 2618 TaxID=3156454 RepID=UPI0033959512